MKNNEFNVNADDFEGLRKKAEKIINNKDSEQLEELEEMTREEILQLFHELQVHQIELELQNVELFEAKYELEQTRARYYELFDLAPVGYCTLSEEGIIKEANLVAASYLEETREELMQKELSQYILPEDKDIYYFFWKNLFATGNHQECELKIQKAKGETFWVSLQAEIIQRDKEKSAVFLTMEDITKRKKKLMYLSYYDSLTKLPNKEYLTIFLQEELTDSSKTNKALLLVNFGDISLANLTLGRIYSQRIIKEFADKLKTIKLDVHLFKYSDASFVIYIDDYTERKQLIDFCNKILLFFDSTFSAANVNKFIDGEIGIVEIDKDKDYKDVNVLLKEAEIAVSAVKKSEQKGYFFFNKEMEEDILRDEKIENIIQDAIKNNDKQELYLEYQPQINLKKNKVTGLEALVRLKNKELGAVSPTKIIDIAEKRRLIIPLGNWVLKTGCQFLKQLEVRGYNDIKIAFNLSLFQLLQADFISNVINISKDTGINVKNLEFEITESVLIVNYNKINDILYSLSKRGIKIALDDFGTGYSSLARIRELNIDYLKIDKCFIDNLIEKHDKGFLTKIFIELAHQLYLIVIAEGVEVNEQKEYLINNDCDMIQGYLFSKPLTEDKIIKFLQGF